VTRTRTSAANFFIIAALALSACNPPPVEENILSKVDRADGKVYATITKTGGDATVSFGYRVYVGGNAKFPTDQVLKMDKGDAPAIQWRNGRLYIDVRCGQIFHYSNFAYIRPIGSERFERISVILRDGGVCADAG